MPCILAVDDDATYRLLYQRVLAGLGVEVVAAQSGRHALERAWERDYAAVLLDISLGDMEGFEVARALRGDERTRHTPILFLTAYRTDSVDIEAGYKIGAVDYLFKPFQPVALQAKVAFFVELHLKSQCLEQTVRQRTAELTDAVTRLEKEALERDESQRKLALAFSEIARLKEQLEAENVFLRQEIQSTVGQHEIMGQSPAIQRVLAAVGQVASTDSTVLILGETGSGKEIIARAIHQMSARKERSMVMVNCAALPANLIESELFGHEKGAFTGAHASAPGRFEIADGSTLFLDEVGDLPLELQPKLLRVLQEGQFERVGSTRTLKVNVRVIAATNRDLGRSVREGAFREDLYYRLNVFPVTLPPLRERLDDIPILARAFVEEFATRMGKRIESISRKSLEQMRLYAWPGNVRELRNVIERSMILANGPQLVIELPGQAQSLSSRQQSLRELEREYIRTMLDKTGWRIRGTFGAAALLGLKPTTLEARIKKLGLTRTNRIANETS